MCGGGGYVAGKPKRSGDWGKEEHIRVQLNIERQQSTQPPKRKWQMLDQEVYGFGTRPLFSSTVLGSAPVLQRNEIFIASNRQENNTIQKYLL